MKKILLFSLITSTVLLAHPGKTNSEGCHTNKKTGVYHCHDKKTKSKSNTSNINLDYKKNNFKSNYSSDKSLTSNYSYNQLNKASDRIVKKYINNRNCDKILTNQNFFTNCYDYKLKSTIYSYTTLYKSKINSKNLKKRPKFYEDLNLPKNVRTKHSDYTRSGFDRGHLITANDASFDFSLKSQKATYAMSNIVPQYPKTNRKSYLKVEDYSREMTNKLGSLEVFQKINFSKFPKKIGKNKLSVPKSFSIILFNNKKKYKECFNIPNDNEIYDLKKMKIDCKRLK